MQTNNYRIRCFQAQPEPKICEKYQNQAYKPFVQRSSEFAQAFFPSLFMTEEVKIREISNEMPWRISTSCWCLACCPVCNHLNSLLPYLTYYMLFCPVVVNMLNPTLVWVQSSTDHVALDFSLFTLTVFLSAVANYTGWSLGILPIQILMLTSWAYKGTSCYLNNWIEIHVLVSSAW